MIKHSRTFVYKWSIYKSLEYNAILVLKSDTNSPFIQQETIEIHGVHSRGERKHEANIQ